MSVVTGSILACLGFLADVFVEMGLLELLQPAFAVIGCALCAGAIASQHRELNSALAKVSLVIVSTMLAVTLGEVTFRVMGYDFDRGSPQDGSVPIFYRSPSVHAGEGIFRRPGPVVWRGKVLCAYLRIHGLSEEFHADEVAVLAEYDGLGFRNPTNFTDWEVVVTGDSFVELGYLPYEELFTTLAGEQLGVRIKNLGVSGTGPISQTFYVKHYGKAASTKDAVLCFFEGNDMGDLDRETQDTESFRAIGFVPQRQKQVSLTKAIRDYFKPRRRAAKIALERFRPNAILAIAGQERPMNIFVNPPSWEQTGQERREALARALAAWADTVRSHGMRPWVMYLPDSHRVFHGSIRYSQTNSAFAQWIPGDFAGGLGGTCTNLNLGFIDTFPALCREVESGRIPYNLIGDTHFSRCGSRAVADVLAQALERGRVR